MSDHAVITWELEYSETVENDRERRERLTTGWDIKGMMEEEPKEGEEAPLARDLAEKEWKRRSEGRARLRPEPTRLQIEAEAKWMGGTITAVLNQYAKQLRITARSKRWWSEDINECRKAVSTAKTAQRHGVGTKQEVRKAQKDLHKTINREKRQMWGGFLQGAERDQHWLALRYCSPWTSNTTPVIRTQLGEEAVTLEEKDRAFRESAFPPPPAGAPAELPEGGEMHVDTTKEAVREAIMKQSVKKAPGPDRPTFRAIRLIWDWDSDRLVELIHACIRTGIHPQAWKTAKGVVLKKPGKPDYSNVKAYRVICLLNCLGKVLEKVVATMISKTCEERQLLHNGQMGSRVRRSATDAVAILIQEVQETWNKGEIAATLLMDVKGAFDHVSKPHLLNRMKELQLDPCLIRWTESFLSDRRVSMVIDGEPMTEHRVTTGVPQGSPVSPILFAIYLSGVFREVEESVVEGVIGLSYADDVAWVVKGNSIRDLVALMEACASATNSWARRNNVEFDLAKTEAIIFSRRKDRPDREAARIRIGTEKIGFNMNATRWLGVWMDSKINLREHHNICMKKAQGVEAGIRRLAGPTGLQPQQVR